MESNPEKVTKYLVQAKKISIEVFQSGSRRVVVEIAKMLQNEAKNLDYHEKDL